MALTQISTDGIKNGTITGSDLATPILIGGTSSRDVGHTHILQLEGTVTTPHSISQISNRADVHASHFDFAKSRGSGLGSNTIVQDDDFLGHILFRGADGTDVSTQSSRISGAVDGTPGSNNIPGRLEFYTQVANGSIAEKARLTSTGVFKMPDNGKISLGGAQSGNGDLEIYHDGTNSNIKNNTNQLNILGNDIRLLNNGASKALIKAFDGGAAELYYNGTKTFETAGHGVNITGGFVQTGNSIINDNGKLQFGNGTDLQIYHDGSNSYIKEVGTGNLNIQSDNTVEIEKANGTDIARFHPDGAVELFYNGTKKFETTNGGINITGSVACSGGASNNLSLPDNGKAKFGTGDDLQIYHDGSDSFIKDTGTGALKICSNLFRVNNAANNEAMIKAEEDAGVTLSFDGSTKFETTSGGVVVTGDIAPTNHVLLGDSKKAIFGAGLDLQIFHNGTHSFLENSTNGLYARSDEILLQSNTGNENYIIATLNGGVELYHDNSKKFETTSNGAKCTGELEIFGVNNGVTAPLSANNKLRFKDNDSTTAGAQPVGTIEWHTNDGNNAGISGFISVQSETDQGAGRMVFGTGTATASERMRIDGSGNVGINTTSPSYRLDVIAGQGAVSRFRQATNNQAISHACIILRHQAANSSQQGVGMVFQNSSGGEVGSIRFGASTSYNTTSDYRLKENVIPISDGITRLKTLKPSRFNFTTNPEITVDGFLAHEVTAVPEAITGSKDQVDSDNNPVYQSIDQSKLVPLLVAAVQELTGKVEVLETEVAALKAA